MRKNIPEIDVIIAVAHWLHSKNYILKTVSIPKGKGINSSEDKERLKKKFPETDILFLASGPDIIVNYDGKHWKIECKGLGVGQTSTLRNNFDRVLASTVSYYDSKTKIRLGLALPKERTYLALINSKIPQALREVLDLWIFLYNSDTNSVEVIEPTQQTPSQIEIIEI